MEKAKSIIIFILLLVVIGLILYCSSVEKEVERKGIENIELIDANKQKTIEVMSKVKEIDNLKDIYSQKQDSLKKSYENENSKLKKKLDNAINNLNNLTDDEHIQLLTEHLSKKDSN